jgi:hypothetical protein
VTTDEYETWFERGVTDGLPIVPPTRERVTRMLAGTRRSAGELLGEMPPNYGRVTVDKAAINAVMAGCRPEYPPVLIAAAEAVCDPAFNLHGVATSTHFSAPLVVVNGPVRARIGLNAGFGVFGPGHRANATIGRALRLLMINVGGARPGEISMSTFGHPGRYTYCIAEHEEASPWPPYHVELGPRAGEQHGDPFRRRGAPRHFRPREPDRPTARGLDRLVNGGILEQQALPPLLPHDARGRSRARPYLR